MNVEVEKKENEWPMSRLNKTNVEHGKRVSKLNKTNVEVAKRMSKLNKTNVEVAKRMSWLNERNVEFEKRRWILIGNTRHKRDLRAAMPRAASSVGVGRRVKRETALVSYNDLMLLWQVTSMTPRPLLNIVGFLCKADVRISLVYWFA